MAEEATDPREEMEHPRRLPPLVGHEKAEAQLARAAASGRLHHAWMLCGPPGIGKSTLAYRFAAHLLSGGDLLNAESLHVDSSSATARWIMSRSHPDLFVLERAFDRKSKKLKSEIAVDDARDLLHFFGKTAGASTWRVAIVDPADDLNQASANALLKIMEEPPPNALLLLVCNHPGRLLRTIRSRCSRLDMSPLTLEQTRQVAERLEGLGEEGHVEGLEAAIRMSGGSPGIAVELLQSGGAKAFAAFQFMPSLSAQALVDLGSRFSSRSSTVEEYEVFHSQLETWVAERSREAALHGGGGKLADVYPELERLNRVALAMNLDRRHAVIQALSLVEKALRPG